MTALTVGVKGGERRAPSSGSKGSVMTAIDRTLEASWKALRITLTLISRSAAAPCWIPNMTLGHVWLLSLAPNVAQSTKQGISLRSSSSCRTEQADGTTESLIKLQAASMLCIGPRGRLATGCCTTATPEECSTTHGVPQISCLCRLAFAQQEPFAAVRSPR